jgi:hypothetical protein
MPHRIAVFRFRISVAIGRSGCSSPERPRFPIAAQHGGPRRNGHMSGYRCWTERLHSSDADAAWNDGNRRRTAGTR